MTLNYNYKAIQRDDKTWQKLPQLPIELPGKNFSIKTVGTLDTGATFIVIPQDIAQSLDLELKDFDEPLETYDKKLKVAETSLVIKFGKGHEHSAKRYNALVPLEEVICGEVILGRNFFNGLKITFDEAAGKFSIKRKS